MHALPACLSNRASPSPKHDRLDALKRDALTPAATAAGATHWGQQVFVLHPGVQCAAGSSMEGTMKISRRTDNHRLMDVSVKHKVRSQGGRGGILFPAGELRMFGKGGASLFPSLAAAWPGAKAAGHQHRGPERGAAHGAVAEKEIPFPAHAGRQGGGAERRADGPVPH